MKENETVTIESKEVVEKINALIKAGVNPAEIDYDELVYQVNVQRSKEFYNE